MAGSKAGNIFKNKKLLAILLVAIVIIAVIVILLIGVGRKNAVKAEIKNMFSSIQTANFNKIAEYVDHDIVNSNVTEGEGTVNENFQVFFSDLNYKVESIKIDGNKATAKLEVKNKDIEAVLNKYATTAISKKLSTIKSDETEEEIDRSLLQYLKEEYDKADMLSTKLEINLNKENGKWKINKENQDGKSIMNAILPRYLKYIGNE